MAFLKDNLQALKVRYPQLAELILKTKPPSELKVIKTRSRYPSIALDLGSKYAFFHSKENPMKEAKAQLEAVDIPSTANILILGLGLGYHLLALKEKIGKENIVIVVEQYPEIFRLALEFLDLKEIILDKNILLLVGKRPEEIFESLKAKIFHLVNNDLTVLRHDTSLLLFRDYYESVEKMVGELIVWGKKNLEAGVRFRRLYQQNIIRNLRYYIASEGLEFMRSQGGSVIIAAAGPSLASSYGVLKELQNKVPIISVDTAIYPLIANGITPSIAISIDPQEVNYIHFERVNKMNRLETILVIDPQVYYKIPRSFPGRIVCPGLRDSKIISLFYPVVGDKGWISKGMSVAHSAFSLALSLGFENIIFVGLDLSFSEDGSHVREAANFMKDFSAGRNLVKVKGKDGTVITDDVFFAYIKHFEVEISKASARCFNASSGAEIAGMPFIEVEDIKTLVEDMSDYISNLSHKGIYRLEGKTRERLNLLLEDWVRKTREIGDLATSVLNDMDIDKAKQIYSDLRRYGVIIDILEETMEAAAVMLSSRRIWKDKADIEKFKLYFQELAAASRFIVKEVSDEDIIGWAG